MNPRKKIAAYYILAIIAIVMIKNVSFASGQEQNKSLRVKTSNLIRK